MRGNVHVRFGGRERGDGVENNSATAPLPTRLRPLAYDEPLDLYEIIRQRYQHGATIITFEPRRRGSLPRRPTRVVELIGTIAAYNMVSRFVVATGVDLE